MSFWPKMSQATPSSNKATPSYTTTVTACPACTGRRGRDAVQGGRRRDDPMAGLSRMMSIMPLSMTGARAQDGAMRNRQQLQRVAHNPGRREGEMVLLISDPINPEGLVPRPDQAWLRLLARLLASSLDRQLASGCVPESNRLLATRAQRLVSPSMRCALARNWFDLLTVARRTAVPRISHTPL